MLAEGSSLAGWTDLAGIGALAAVLAAAILGIRRLLPGAREIEIADSGVRLRYGGGSEELIRWRSGDRLLLRDYSGEPEMLERGRAYHLRTARFWTRRTLVTKETVEAILGFARSTGVRVVPQTNAQGRWGRPPLEYRLGS